MAELVKFAEFSTAIQFDEPVTEDEVYAIGEALMTIACGGCRQCGTGEHCDNQDHECKRVAVQGGRLVPVSDTQSEWCDASLHCGLEPFHDGPHEVALAGTHRG